MSTDYMDLLNSNAGTHKAPASVPPGAYLLRVIEHKLEKKPDTEAGPGKFKAWIDTTFKYVEPAEGVDMELLREREINLAEKTIRNRFFLSEKAMFFLDDPDTGFIAKCGVDMAGKSVSDALAETKNCEVKAVIAENPATDGSDRTFNNIVKFLRVDE